MAGTPALHVVEVKALRGHFLNDVTNPTNSRFGTVNDVPHFPTSPHTFSCQYLCGRVITVRPGHLFRSDQHAPTTHPAGPNEFVPIFRTTTVDKQALSFAFRNFLGMGPGSSSQYCMYLARPVHWCSRRSRHTCFPLAGEESPAETPPEGPAPYRRGGYTRVGFTRAKTYVVSKPFRIQFGGRLTKN